MNDLISRQDLLDKFEPWLKVKDYNDGELNMLKAILYEIRFMPPATDTNVGTKLSTNLAEVGTDRTVNGFPIDADDLMLRVEEKYGFMSRDRLYDIIRKMPKYELPPAEPKKETATVSVGISKGGVTMWYECEACGEPVDQGDTFCSGCGRRLIHE